MKAALIYGARDIRIEEVPEPELNDANVIIKVHRASICNGSDVAIFKGERNVVKAYPFLKKLPVIGGHECAGEVIAVGKCVEGFKVGERVSASWKPTGSFAEYNEFYPDRSVIVKLKDDISCEEGSVVSPFY